MVYQTCRSIAVFLTATVCVFNFGCSPDPTAEKSPMAANHDHKESPGQTEHDHGDPEKQKRMGIHHYNEGNKFLREKESREAIRNYKMALHHAPDFLEASINLSTAYLQGKMFDEAHATLQTLQKKNPENPLIFYNLACYYALTAQTDPSLQALQKAVALGYKDFKTIKTDPDLENLRKDPKFTEWIEKF